jgi:hypothetical protein
MVPYCQTVRGLLKWGVSRPSRRRWYSNLKSIFGCRYQFDTVQAHRTISNSGGLLRRWSEWRALRDGCAMLGLRFTLGGNDMWIIGKPQWHCLESPDASQLDLHKSQDLNPVFRSIDPQTPKCGEERVLLAVHGP